MSWRLCRWLLCGAFWLIPLSIKAQDEVSTWLTTADRLTLLQPQPALKLSRVNSEELVSGPTIDVAEQERFQTMDGFGFALTGGSAQLMMRMDAGKRASLLHELFAAGGDSIGVSYLRVSIGASDMNDHVFTYDDLPEGQQDPQLVKFSLDPDRKDVIPILKQILKINPEIKILATPWSAPAWMKTNGSMKGGKLRPEYYGVYAAYFVRYIEGMKAEGIPIDAITIQNEPLNEKNTPSMQMLASEQARLIGEDVGPLFLQRGVHTKLVLYDHNCDVPEYPISILENGGVRQYVDGSGFHLYGGKIEALSEVHERFPDKNLYFTEQMVVDGKNSAQSSIDAPVRDIVIGATRNWSRSVLLWNLAADPHFGPHTDNGGCPVCQGAITLDGDIVTRNAAYYTIAHASKFVPSGSVRIGSKSLDALPNVAFKRPDGKIVLLVVNSSGSAQRFSVRDRGRTFQTSLSAGAVATFVWK